MALRWALLMLASSLILACGSPQPRPSSESTQRSDAHPAPPRNTTVQIPYQVPALDENEDDLWQRIRRELSLERDHPAVRDALARYDEQSDHWTLTAERAQPWLYHIVSAVQARELPMELALLPFVESAFDPLAGSDSRAAGLWQIIPGTASELGLNRDTWYDGRHDVVASTEAALDYFTTLLDRFDGDWLLTLAAYNAGPGRVQRAVEANRSQNLPIDFWSLPLPEETLSYVPRVLAFAAWIDAAAERADALPPLPDAPVLGLITTESPLELRVAAELSGVSIDELNALNPGLQRGITPADTYTLVVPAHAADSLQETLDALPPQQAVASQTYTIRNGDTLISIGRRFGVTVTALQSLNQLSGHNIRAGRQLLIPLPPAKAASAQ